MALGNITYKTISDAVVSWISSNCTNITNLSGMSSAAKSGYTYTVGTKTSGGAYTETATAKMTNALSITAPTSSTVTNDMNSFLSTIGASSIINNNISPQYFFKFINDMVAFCTTKIAYVTNQTNNSSSVVTYRVYHTSNTTYSYTINVASSSATTYAVIASDINTILTNIVNMATLNSGTRRVLPCKYTWTLS